MSGPDYSALSMLELFRLEAETQTQQLTADLLALEQDPSAPRLLESCMRAAHSLKGAARIVGLEQGVSVTHAMEDCFVAAQRQRLRLDKPQIDLLLRGVDLISNIAAATETERAAQKGGTPLEVASLVAQLEKLLAAPAPVSSPVAALEPSPADVPVNDAASAEGAERTLRITAEDFDRLLGLSAQALVESRWLGPFQRSLLRLKCQQDAAVHALDVLRDSWGASSLEARGARALTEARQHWLACRARLAESLVEIDAYDRRVALVAHRLHEAALSCRMRPFSDAVVALPRMVRDLALSLGKRARLEIVGPATPVDRDMLAKLEAPLSHLLRNAVDHGVDPPEARLAAGKPETAVVRLEARHVAGMLEITISDDGPGIDVEGVRRAVVARGLVDASTADHLSEREVYDFLFLPGFTLRSEVTEISGRGVGLDVVQSALKALRGSVRVSSRPGQGSTFQLCLPLAVSTVRTLIAEIGGEPYAFPLASIERALSVAPEEIQTLEGRQHFAHAGQQVGLVAAHQVFGVDERKRSGTALPVILVSASDRSYALVVERLCGVRELVVQPLDPRLGKIKDIAAGALLEDGAPALIVDVEDLVRSIEKLLSGGRLSRVRHGTASGREPARKRVLVVDDSFTVRELERKLLDAGGYDVEVAVDGMDGWNAVRAGAFDLVVTDIDMPRMDGIDLVKLIRRDARLRTLPVMVVSYKDRQEDRQRGLEAGADYYLAKGSFKSEGLLQAVVDLIGETS